MSVVRYVLGKAGTEICGSANAQPATRAATPTPRTRFCFGRNLAGSEEGQLTRAMRTGPTSIKTLPVPMRVHIHHGVPLPKVAAIEKRKCSGQTMSSCAGGRESRHIRSYTDDEDSQQGLD